MKYDKLVRDKIPTIIFKNGGKPVTHIATDKEYWQKLKDKLREEVGEFLDSEKAEEIADVLEVIDAICKHKNYKKKDVLKLQMKKARQRGKFNKKIILEES